MLVCLANRFGVGAYDPGVGGAIRLAGVVPRLQIEYMCKKVWIIWRHDNLWAHYLEKFIVSEMLNICDLTWASSLSNSDNVSSENI